MTDVGVRPQADPGVPEGPIPARVDFPALDTLRIIGAMAVLTTHAAFWAAAYTDYGTWGVLLARLDVGVAIFFVLSGFLLSRPWIVAASDGTARPDARRYLWRRVLRIMPVYLVTAVLALSLIGANRDESALDWLVTLTMTDIYFNDGPPHGLTHTWSLATEVSFYVLLPVLMVLVLGRAPRGDRSRQRGPVQGLVLRRIFTALVIGVVINVVWLLAGHDILRLDDRTPLNQWLPGMFLWFAVGITFAVVDVIHRSPGPVPRPARALAALGLSPGVCWTAAGALLIIASTPLAGPTLLAAPTPDQAVTKHLLYAAIGGLLVLPAVFGDPGSRFMTVMSLPALRHLGHISYGVFCLHVPVLHLLFWATDLSLFTGDLWLIWSLATVGSLIAAEIVYRCVERPAMRWGSSNGAAARARTTETPSTTR